MAFQSAATNLVTPDDFVNEEIFVHDRDSDEDGIFDEPGQIETVRVSKTGAGAEVSGDSSNPAISADGRFVAFRSFASNLVAGDTNATGDIFVHDRQTGATQRVSLNSAANQANSISRQPAISADGRFVAFDSMATNLIPGGGLDANDSCEDVFVFDRQTGGLELVGRQDAADGRA